MADLSTNFLDQITQSVLARLGPRPTDNCVPIMSSALSKAGCGRRESGERSARKAAARWWST
ncbi:hypothetical protein VXQ18_13385 [Brucella abortus]|nr:hypothetical protein [Brucella abortus]